MYEIERAGPKRAGADVVSDDLDVRGVYLTQKPDLQVGSDHAPGRANQIGQPPGDRPSPPTDFQTPSAHADPETLNALFRKRVETLLQQLKTARFVLGGMRERVVRSLTHSAIISRGTPRRPLRASPYRGFASLCGTIIQDSVSVCSDTAVRGSSSDRMAQSTNVPTAYGAVWTIAAWKV